LRIILYEFKKIWNIKIILALIVFCAMYFYVFMYFNLEHYPNGHPGTEHLEFAALLTKEYGQTVNGDEFEEFYTYHLEELVRQADAIFARDLKAREAGLIDYAAFVDISETWHSGSNEAQWEVIGRLYNDPENNYVLYKLDALNSIHSWYYASDEYWDLRVEMASTGLSLKRTQQVRDTDEFLSPIASEAIYNVTRYVLNLVILIGFAIIILHTPLITTDHLRQMRFLQYSSKEGRKLLGKQFAAVLLSSIILITLLILIFGGIYTINGTHVFWNNYISAFSSSYLSALPLTFGQYALILTAMIYFFGITLSTFAFVISHICKSYISLIASSVFACSVAVILCNNLIFIRPLIRWVNVIDFALFEPLIIVMLLFTGMITATFLIKMERKIDI
jgi:hypothetical protein